MTGSGIARANIAGFAVYCFGLLVLKLFLLTAAHYDFSKEIYFARELRWVYDVANPPLYTWLLHGVQRLIGPGLPSVLVLNHVLLFAIMAAYFALARRALGGAGDAALATWSLLLLQQFDRFQYARTHTFLLLLFCALGLLLFLKAMAEPRSRTYALLGLVLGAGVLSKFNYALFIASLAGAAVIFGPARRVLLDRQIGIALACFAAVVLPYALILADAAPALISEFRQRTVGPAGPGYLAGLLPGLKKLALELLHFPYMLIPVAAIAILPALRRRPESRPEFGPEIRLIAGMMLVGLAIVTAGVLTGMISDIFKRFLFAFLFPLPIFAVALLRAYAPGRWAWRRYLIGVALVVLIAVGGRIVNMTSLCMGLCDDMRPHARLAAHLAQEGVARGMILTDNRDVPGALLTAFPRRPMRVTGLPYVAGHIQAGAGAECLVLWRTPSGASSAAPPKALAEAAGVPAATLTLRAQTIPLRWLVRPIALPKPLDQRPYRLETWRYAALKPGQGTCR